MTLEATRTPGLYPQNMNLEPTRTSEIDPQTEACLHLVQKSEEAGQRAEASTNRLFERMKQTIEEQGKALKNAEERRILDAKTIEVLEKQKKGLEKALSDEKKRNENLSKAKSDTLSLIVNNVNSYLTPLLAYFDHEVKRKVGDGAEPPFDTSGLGDFGVRFVKDKHKEYIAKMTPLNAKAKQIQSELSKLTG